MVNSVGPSAQEAALQRKSAQEGKKDPRIQEISKAIPKITITDLNGQTTERAPKQVSPIYHREDSLPEHLREEGL